MALKQAWQEFWGYELVRQGNISVDLDNQEERQDRVWNNAAKFKCTVRAFSAAPNTGLYLKFRGFCMVWSGLFQTGDELLFLLFSRNPFASKLPPARANQVEVFQLVVLHRLLHRRYLDGQIPAKQTYQRWKMVINWASQPQIYGLGTGMFGV